MPSCFGKDKEPKHEPLSQHDTDEGGYESAPSQMTSKSITEVYTTTDDEAESRLSRRSSVLVDLLTLFRRSSSILRPHSISTRFMSGEEDFDEDDDEEETRNMSKDRILEAIRHKKEIIGKLRNQPWNMKRKRRTLKVAQRHLQRQEAKVSKARLYKAEAGRKLTQLNRWFDNFKIYLIPWEAKIKRIESHFGSVVSSYFTFLRWTLGVNVTMTMIMLLFVIIPEWLADSRMEVGSERYNRTVTMKVMPEEVRQRADEIFTVWDFGGYLQYSLLFYGYYSRETFFGETIKYSVPVAYFLVNIFVLGYSFFTILRKMASNARNSKLSSGKTEQYVFNWKTFTGWDYTIGNAETAGNVHMANVIKFREAIAEYAVNMKKKFAWLQIFVRLIANIMVFIIIGFSVWAILAVSQIKENDTFIKQNAVAITVSFITLIFPNVFELIGKMEQYHPRTALRTQLARVLCLYIVNYYTLIVSLMIKLRDLENERKALEESHRQAMNFDFLHHNTNYTLARSLRQILNLPGSYTPTPYTYFSYTPVTTTPAPPKPWTTVFSDFGPLGVSNPKAVVSRNNLPDDAPVVVTQVIGPNINWKESTVINNTGFVPGVTYTQPFLLPNYQDMCWETIIGQEITKLVTMDLLMTIAAILVIDFFRGLFCRYCNLWWFWNLEKTFPEYGEFKVAENVLHLVNNQGMIWLGLFFVPMLPLINNIKLMILMYIRAWSVMTCNVPARQIFRASRSSNFYLMLLLLMLFLCTLPVGYVIASRKPSKTCGPFGDQPYFYSVITNVLHENLNSNLVDAIKYTMSPGIVIPVLLLLLLVIYFLFALIRGLREANSDLSTQLMHERTEEKKKIFELAGGKKKRDLRLNKRQRIEVPTPRPSKPTFQNGHYSSDEDSHPKSIRSAKSGNAFVPSLGSVSEVDHSDGDEHEDEGVQRPRPKLTLKQKFLVCIGWSDPKEYESIPTEDRDVEEGRREKSEETEEEQDDERRDSESRYLLPPQVSRHGSRDRSDASWKSDGERRMREASFHTASQNSRSEDRRAVERTPSYRSASYRNNSQPLEHEFSIPQPRITSNPLLDLTPRRTHSDNDRRSESRTPSLSQTVSLPVPSNERASTKEIEQTARRLLQPVQTTFNARYGMLPNESASNLDPTRPPSTDGSLSDPSPLPESTWYASNPHSSYTSAMMSPIMNEMMSTDEGTDDEKAKLIFEKPSPPEPSRQARKEQSTSRSQKPVQRPPRFRISMSPPRKKLDAPDSESSSRRFEMRVAEPAIQEVDEERPESREKRSRTRDHTQTREHSRSNSPRKIKHTIV